MGAANYRNALSKAQLCSDPLRMARVQTVSRRLIAATERYYRESDRMDEYMLFDWQFNVIQDESPNATCHPGGGIFVNSGMLDVAVSDSHLAAVIGHEMAHALARHSAERITDEKMVQGMLGVMANSTKNSEKVIANYAYLAEVGFLKPHSRFEESEADHIGLILMSIAGYDPYAAGDLWRRMALLPGGDATPAYLSTHPVSEDRMRQLDALVPTVLPIYNACRAIQ